MENEHILSCLKHRANINTFRMKGKTVIVYNDHRYILNVIKYAFENKVIKKPINVITLDYHSDLYDNPRLLTADNINIVRNYGLRDFWNYVEFEHSNQDDDWLIGGMEYGLINDAAMLFVRDFCSTEVKFNEPYFDKAQIKHNLILIDLNSSLKELETFEAIRNNIFILDIDLDFATNLIEGKHYPMSNSEMDAFFQKEIMLKKNKEISLNDLFLELIEKSAFITICMESHLCGGFLGSNQILNYLDEKYFNNELTK